jgi:hypothetical protein
LDGLNQGFFWRRKIVGAAERNQTPNGDQDTHAQDGREYAQNELFQVERWHANP